MGIWISFKNKLRPLMKRAEFDRPVFFSVLLRAWRVVAGPITTLLIASFFTAEIQGYYYTFYSLLEIQTFIELGLTIVILQFASHEWAKLSLDKEGNIVGDSGALSRLASLAHFSTKWFAVGALLITIGLGIGGYFFFLPAGTLIDWKAPWLGLCLFTGVTVSLFPILSLLEGCNQVSRLYTF